MTFSRLSAPLSPAQSPVSHIRLEQRMRPWGHDILTRIATNGKRFVVRADEKLTAFYRI
jgi:hypothetical protein